MFKKVALFGLLFLVGAALGLFAGYRRSSSHELVREWRPLDNPEGREFFKAYDLIARLRLADIGSAMRLENPKEGLDRRKEYPNLILEGQDPVDSSGDAYPDRCRDWRHLCSARYGGGSRR